MFKLRIETKNAAFDGNQEPWELIRILTKVILKLQDGSRDGILMDINGNRVGNWTLTKR